MTYHTVVATFTCKSKEARDDLVKFLDTDPNGFQCTRGKKGCRSIEGYTDKADETSYILIAHWDSAEDHANYMKYRGERGDFGEDGPILKYLAKPLDVKVFAPTSPWGN